jgi:hypothetical protein
LKFTGQPLQNPRHLEIASFCQNQQVFKNISIILVC